MFGYTMVNPCISMYIQHLTLALALPAFAIAIHRVWNVVDHVRRARV